MITLPERLGLNSAERLRAELREAIHARCRLFCADRCRLFCADDVRWLTVATCIIFFVNIASSEVVHVTRNSAVHVDCTQSLACVSPRKSRDTQS